MYGFPVQMHGDTHLGISKGMNQKSKFLVLTYFACPYKNYGLKCSKHSIIYLPHLFSSKPNALKTCLDISNSGAQLIAFLGPTV